MHIFLFIIQMAWQCRFVSRSNTLVLTERSIAMKFYTGIPGPEDESWPLTYRLAPPADQYFHLSFQMFQHIH